MRIPLFTRLHDTLFPHRCLICGSRLGPYDSVVCSVCNMHLPRTRHSLTPEDNAMTRLFWGRLTPERAAAFIRHHPHSDCAMLIYAIKYGGNKSAARAVGRLAADELAADGFFSGIDIIVPVPLARERERQRGYNQSLLLACAVSERTGIAVGRDVLERTTFVRPQTGLHRQERYANVADAFRVTDAARLRGRHVLLVDDVVTSGATMTACGEAVVASGAACVSIMSIGMSDG